MMFYCLLFSKLLYAAPEREPDLIVKYNTNCHITDNNAIISRFNENVQNALEKPEIYVSNIKLDNLLRSDLRRLNKNLTSNSAHVALDDTNRGRFIKDLVDGMLRNIRNIENVEFEYLTKMQTELIYSGDSTERMFAYMSLVPCVTVQRHKDLIYTPESREAHSTKMQEFIESTKGQENKYHPMGDTKQNIGIDDEYFPYQWYLGGPPEQPYGSNIIKAWNYMLNRDENSTFESTTASDFGESLSIVVVDVGCGENDDLLYDATHPTCHEELDAKSELRGNVNSKLEKHYKGSMNSEFCAIPHLPNSGHHQFESYFQDPMHHGVGTNSIIGAGWNDKKGITGVCPFCRVKCIKIGSGEEESSVSISLAGIFRSLEFIAFYKDSYPISNHSYGGFTMDLNEVEGHKKLNELHHTVVTAAGNYSCDIDPLAEAFGAFGTAMSQFGKPVSGSTCKSTPESALATSPYMPGSIQLPNKFDIGASTIDGGLSEYSNWGKRSVEILAPGEYIVSLNSSTSSDNDGGVVVQDGTSFSSPIVTGSLALLHRHITNKCGVPTPESLWDYMKRGATMKEDLKDKTISGGILNIYESMKLVPDLCNKD